MYPELLGDLVCPCKAELADIYQLQHQYEDRLVVIEINKAESVDKASVILSKIRGGWTAGLVSASRSNGIDLCGDLLYGRHHTLPIDTLPISVFIDARGVVTQQCNGQMSAARCTTLLSRL